MATYSYCSLRYGKEPKTIRNGYEIQDFVYPQGKVMTKEEMTKYSKKMLVVSKREGHDRNLRTKDLDNNNNAWRYLKNIGIGRRRL